MVSEQFVIDFTKNLKPLIEEIEPSFFEITVAMAFEWFVQQKVDIAVIETGLGGRFDSTNIITPELSIITNIGWDHMNILGNTLEKIAFEKAGIIKPGVPVIVGETLRETKHVFEERAKELSAPLYFVNEDRWIPEWRIEKNELIVATAKHDADKRKLYHLDLTGLYQTKNLLTVLEAVDVLINQGWILEEHSIQKALSQVKKLTGLHGRWEVVHPSPLVVLDVAHNEDGIKQLVSNLEHCNFHKLHIVIGMVRDKEIDKIFELLPKYAHYYFTKAQIARAIPEIELMKRAINFSLKGHSYSMVNEALQEAVNSAHKEDMILVCGSVFVVGEVDVNLIKW
jgi:dihydrofolate synthase/folylpolyglutamate synthase